MKRTLGSVMLILLAGCATPKATYEQGVAAGAIQVMTQKLEETKYQRQQSLINRIIELEDQNHLEIATQAMNEARSLRNPALAADQGWKASQAYNAARAKTRSIWLADLEAAAIDRDNSLQLGEAAIDLHRMSLRQDAARSKFQKETLTGLIELGSLTIEADQNRKRLRKPEPEPTPTPTPAPEGVEE